MSTETSEGLLVLIALVAAVVNYLQQQEQNRIFREQNRIFAESGGQAMPPEKPRFVWLKRYWPTLITVLVFLLIGYDIYERRAHNSSASSAPIAPWPYVLILLLIAVGLGLMIGRLKRDTLSENVDDVLAGLPKAPLPTEEPKKPSKLVIYSANYRAWKGAGETFDVTDFLRKTIAGDCLILSPIENHSFMFDGKNYVPRDPLFGQPKRLEVTYSYDGEKSKTIQRAEHARLVLPEDSAIEWLEKQMEQLKANQPKPSLVPEFRREVLETVSKLQRFLAEHGDEPKVERQLPESVAEFQQRWRATVLPWQAKFRGDYRIQFGESVRHLRNEILSRAAIDDWELNSAIEKAEHDPNHSVQAVTAVAKKLWDLGFWINV